ncbi:MAG TPA: hypothetical protein VG734_26020 [Lacunisphaera sp.]|nr:hypothetical protein [Lacunisphaera sp.]
MQAQTSHATELDSAAFDSNEEQSGIRERPKRAKRNSLPAFLSQESESDLRRYFRNGGSSATTRSTTAACLAIIEQRRKIAVPCETCGGDVKAERPGTGFVNSKTFHRRPDQQGARGKRGRRTAATEHERETLSLLDIEAPPAAAAEQPAAPAWLAMPELPAAFDGDMLCPDCEGRCWLVGAVSARRRRKSTRPIPKASPFRVTRPSLDGLPNVYPLTSQDPPKGYELSDEMHADLTWLAKMSRRIMRLLDQNPNDGQNALEVLGCYAAPDGGNVGALWHLVPSGRTMLRTNPLKLHHSQLFANLREAQRQKYDEKRFLQFKAANEQALKLFEWACTLWNAAAPPSADEGEAEQELDHEAEIEAALAGEFEVLASGRADAPTAPLKTVLVGATSERELLRIAPPALPNGGLTPEEQQRFLDGLRVTAVGSLLSETYRQKLEGEFESSGLVFGLDPAAPEGDTSGLGVDGLFERAAAVIADTMGELSDERLRKLLATPIDIPRLVREQAAELEPKLAYDPETKRITGSIPLGRPISAEQAEEWRALGATEAPPPAAAPDVADCSSGQPSPGDDGDGGAEVEAAPTVPAPPPWATRPLFDDEDDEPAPDAPAADVNQEGT